MDVWQEYRVPGRILQVKEVVRMFLLAEFCIQHRLTKPFQQVACIVDGTARYIMPFIKDVTEIGSIIVKHALADDFTYSPAGTNCYAQPLFTVSPTSQVCKRSITGSGYDRRRSRNTSQLKKLFIGNITLISYRNPSSPDVAILQDPVDERKSIQGFQIGV